MDESFGELGQGLVAYAFIMLLVAIVVIIILALLGPTVSNLYSSIVLGL
jgi:pilus assembly protein Flp/PilA